MGVVAAFVMDCQAQGWELVSIHQNFPDAVVSRLETGKTFLAEFEYLSSNFKLHGHDPLNCDLIICFNHDWRDCLLPVLDISQPNWGKTDVSAASPVEKENMRLKIENEYLKNQLARLTDFSEKIELPDLQEFVSLAWSTMGLGRRTWTHHFFKSGNECTRGIYDAMIERLVDIGAVKYSRNGLPHKKVIKSQAQVLQMIVELPNKTTQAE